MHATPSTARSVPFFVPLLNPLMSLFVRLGVPVGGPMALLTVRGRRSGVERTTPVSVFEFEGSDYLFGTFGDTQWVRNLRAAGSAVLTSGRHRRSVTATELSPDEAGPILQGALRRYLGTPMRLFLERYYAGSADGSAADYVELAEQHPVFRLGEIIEP
jgi:deazaflavin-dependent oxidoreductase (nitroreductase family)